MGGERPKHVRRANRKEAKLLRPLRLGKTTKGESQLHAARFRAARTERSGLAIHHRRSAVLELVRSSSSRIASTTSAGTVQVVKAGLHGPEELDVGDVIEIDIRHQVEHRPLEILRVDCLPALHDRLMDHPDGDVVLVSQVAELLDQPRHHPLSLRDDVAEVADGLPHSDGFRSLDGPVLRSLGVVRIVALIHRRLRLEHAGGEVFVQEGVAELVVADLPILARVKVSQQCHHQLVLEVGEAKLLQCCAELPMSNDTVVVLVEPSEDIPHEGVLLAHRLPQLLHHTLSRELLELTIRIGEQL
mmetsp:Transcript_121628/g.351078  ORF Transcript_121628/g.351078 Transcript_121628/m.351078 type:complete len:302 (+) Transcript_121628:112-1017(+)